MLFAAPCLPLEESRIEQEKHRVSGRKEVRNMMTRLSMIFVALVVTLGVASFVQVPTSLAAIHHTYVGRVVSYDVGTNTLVVSGEHGEKVFNTATALTNGGIQPNETVKVRYTKDEGRMVADSVRVMGPGWSK
jgi:hypothetical protein